MNDDFPRPTVRWPIKSRVAVKPSESLASTGSRAGLPGDAVCGLQRGGIRYDAQARRLEARQGDGARRGERRIDDGRRAKSGAGRI